MQYCNCKYHTFRDGLLKMKAAYEQNPALGDPVSIEQQLPEINSRIEKLQIQLNKYQVTYFANSHTKTTCTFLSCELFFILLHCLCM